MRPPPWNASRARWLLNSQGYRSRQRHINGRAVEERKSRMVMESLLGRPLLPTEHVRHRDRNRANDNPSNLFITKPGGPGIRRKVIAGAMLLMSASFAHAGWFVTKSVDCATANWKANDLIRALDLLKVPHVNVPTNDPLKVIVVYPDTNTPPTLGYRRLFVFVDDPDFCAKWQGIGKAIDTLAPEAVP